MYRQQTYLGLEGLTHCHQRVHLNLNTVGNISTVPSSMITDDAFVTPTHREIGPLQTSPLQTITPPNLISIAKVRDSQCRRHALDHRLLHASNGFHYILCKRYNRRADWCGGGRLDGPTQHDDGCFEEIVQRIPTVTVVGVGVSPSPGDWDGLGATGVEENETGCQRVWVGVCGCGCIV
jgi:hypothetical protein